MQRCHFCMAKAVVIMKGLKFGVAACSKIRKHSSLSSPSATKPIASKSQMKIYLLKQCSEDE